MSKRFDVMSTKMDELKILIRNAHVDDRGLFERFFCIRELDEILGGRSIVQINRTLTEQKGVVRGMHFQRAPNSEMKFVSCIRGEVFDVVVDLRFDSKTFLQWHSELLSPGVCKTIVIPEGFAHGFQAITNDCEMLYLHTAAYSPPDQCGLNPLDPRLGIAWPLPIKSLSERDSAHPMIAEDYDGDWS